MPGKSSYTLHCEDNSKSGYAVLCGEFTKEGALVKVTVVDAKDIGLNKFQPRTATTSYSSKQHENFDLLDGLVVNLKQPGNPEELDHLPPKGFLVRKLGNDQYLLTKSGLKTPGSPGIAFGNAEIVVTADQLIECIDFKQPTMSLANAIKEGRRLNSYNSLNEHQKSQLEELDQRQQMAQLDLLLADESNPLAPETIISENSPSTPLQNTATASTGSPQTTAYQPPQKANLNLGTGNPELGNNNNNSPATNGTRTTPGLNGVNN